MKIKTKGFAAIAVMAAAAVVLVGCTSGTSSTSGSGGGTARTFNATVSSVLDPSTKTGGTLKLLSGIDCDSWDPARTYYGFCWNLQRLFSRGLIGYQKVNGTSYKLVPDLATNMGTHNADYTSWTYTLKSGLQVLNGKAIVPMDIKYAVERLYASDVITGGPTQYFTGLITTPLATSGAAKGQPIYAGPYKDGDMPDSAMSVSGNSITFHLSKPFADFNYLLALPTSDPVPYKVEGGTGFSGATYTKGPVSDGPYEFTNYTPNKSVTFVRNKYWKQSTDTIRHPLVNEVDFTVDSSASDIDSKLSAGTADARADGPIGTVLQSKILTNPKVKVNADDPAGDSTNYLVIPSSVIPNPDCRKAIFYATDKAAILAAAGGPADGVIANSFTPPGIPGYDPSYNPYPTGANNTGDVAKAKAALVACGKPNGFATKYAYATGGSATAAKVFQAEQTALKRVNITITPATADGSSYYSTFVGSPSNVKSQGLGIIAAGWGADFPTDFGFYQSIMNGASIKSEGNSNYGSLSDPTINKILDDTVTPASQAIGVTLNHAVMDSATQLPTSFGKNLYYRNPRLVNVTSNNALAFGIYDFVNVGVGG